MTALEIAEQIARAVYERHPNVGGLDIVDTALPILAAALAAQVEAAEARAQRLEAALVTLKGQAWMDAVNAQFRSMRAV